MKSTAACKVIACVALSVAVVLLAAGEAWHLAHANPVFNFPVISNQVDSRPLISRP
jgi:hypothetical protein